MDVGGVLWDGLSKLYMSIAAVWTAILIPGAIILIRNRQLPYLRIRNIPLALCAVITLHIYLCLCFCVYMLRGNFPCQTEFWIMSIYLPLGIALFQASNTQLLYISALQKRYALTDPLAQDTKQTGRRNSWRRSMRVVMSYGPTKNTLTFIAVGMILQFLCTLLVFLLSKKFSYFGVVGKAVPPTALGRGECRKGWEWWPSIAWQLAWTWLYAPYLLWKVRGINDVHGWRVQTLVCCLAGLPASPLWLLALYEPTMKATVSPYWTPPLWFAPSIMVMQGFTIFAPCAVVYKNRRLESETRQIISEWEHKKRSGTSSTSLSSDSTMVESKSRSSLHSAWSTSKSRSNSNAEPRNGELYTMAALEKSLQINPKPLLLFAALKDFSGENISFLQHVSEWKAIWAPPSSLKVGFMRKIYPDHRDQAILRREQYTLAVHIYSAFVSMRFSDFPINISSAHLKDLAALFEDAAQKIHGGNSKYNSAASPFDEPAAAAANHDDLESFFGRDKSPSAAASSESIIYCASPETKHFCQVQAFKLSSIHECLPPEIEVPPAFGPASFDDAERHIKGLVLTNTWPKFVNAGYAKKSIIDRRRSTSVKYRFAPRGFGSTTSNSFSRIFRLASSTEEGGIRASA
ncbi:hypothetical protein DV738_g3009, partial [Chaetothyriales sp. CBS 135597]